MTIKKMIALFLSIIMIASVTCACSEDADTPENPSVESAENDMMPKEQMAEIFSGLEYNTGIYTLEIVEILSGCAKFGWDYVSYEENKNDYLTADTIAKYEASQFSQYLDNSYFLRVDGKILHNPEVPNYYTDDKTILNILIFADENYNYVGHAFVEKCAEFDTCAILMATAY